MATAESEPVTVHCLSFLIIFTIKLVSCQSSAVLLWSATSKCNIAALSVDFYICVTRKQVSNFNGGEVLNVA